MSTLTHDVIHRMTRWPARSRLSTGLVFAIVSAVTFGVSGALATPLLAGGWTPGAVVLARVGLGALAVTPFGLASLRGRWHLLADNAGLVASYGLFAVAGAQFCYFSAISHMEVGPALLIEYTAPAAVVGFLWLRWGERPGRLTVLGAALAAAGLVLVLDLLSGASLSAAGVGWAMAAMVGLAIYFIVNSSDSNTLPPLALGWAGLTLGGIVLGLLGLVGVLPMGAATRPASYAGVDVAWWMPLVGLGVLTAAVAYVTGIAAGKRLGSRLASFVALAEVVAGVAWAWALLGQLPGPTQIAGGLLILAGVVAVKAGEGSSAASVVGEPTLT